MDLKICSLNVRGLGDRLKRRKTFNWLRAKSSQFICCKKRTVLKIQLQLGHPNGAIKLCLAAAQAPVKERFDVKTNFLVYHGLVSCIKLLRNAIEKQNETNRNFSTFVENFM